jgi:hypothetical protein
MMNYWLSEWHCYIGCFLYSRGTKKYKKHFPHHIPIQNKPGQASQRSLSTHIHLEPEYVSFKPGSSTTTNTFLTKNFTGTEKRLGTFGFCPWTTQSQVALELLSCQWLHSLMSYKSSSLLLLVPWLFLYVHDSTTTLMPQCNASTLLLSSTSASRIFLAWKEFGWLTLVHLLKLNKPPIVPWTSLFW